MAAATAMGPTKVNGNSRASADPEILRDILMPIGVEGFSSGLSSEGILSELGERLRIQPGGEGDKRSYAERDGLRVAHDWPRGFPGSLEPGVDDDAEVVVERGNDVEHGEDGEHGMVRFDERKEDEVLTHEACGGRNPGERKHEDEEQHGGGGATVIQAVQIFKFFADETLLPHDDKDGKSTGGNEDVRKQVIRNSCFRGFRQCLC